MDRANIPAGTPGGLASETVSALRARYGPNSLPPERIRPWWLRLGAELTHFFALMLWAAAALAVAAGTPELGWAIVAVVVVNALFAFFQEARAERAASKLRDLLPARVTVRRDGSATTVEASDLVPGDVVVLATESAGSGRPPDPHQLRVHDQRVDAHRRKRAGAWRSGSPGSRRDVRRRGRRRGPRGGHGPSHTSGRDLPPNHPRRSPAEPPGPGAAAHREDHRRRRGHRRGRFFARVRADREPTDGSLPVRDRRHRGSRAGGPTSPP